MKGTSFEIVDVDEIGATVEFAVVVVVVVVVLVVVDDVLLG